MSCRIKTAGKEVSEVLAPNLKPSILWKSIRQEYTDMNSMNALDIYLETQTDKFLSMYEGRKDKNNEPAWIDAKDMLIDAIDRALHKNEYTTDIREVATYFEMDNDGYIPSSHHEMHIQEVLDKSDMGFIRVNTNDYGRKYFTVKGDFYNPYNQSIPDGSVRDVRVRSAINNLIRSLGIEIEFNADTQENVLAQADTLMKLIKISEGAEEAITEEALHILMSMMRGTKLYNDMLDGIENTDEYKGVVADYSKLQGYTEEGKLREEAAVKVLERVLNEQPTSVLDRIIQFLQRLFRRDTAAVSAFKTTAGAILKQNYDRLHLNKKPAFTFKDETFFKVKPNLAVRDATLKKLDNTISEMTHSDLDNIYIRNGTRRFKYRVSHHVDQHRRYVYGISEFDPAMKEMYTTKGTILHAYHQHLMSYIDYAKRHEDYPMKGKTIRQLRDYIEDKVYDMIKDDPNFKKYDRDYFKIKQRDFTNLYKGLKHFHDTIMESDPNAVLRFEVTLPIEKKDTAGTIDLVVVHGDGRMSLYDYKNIRKRYDDNYYYQIDDRKLQIYDVQLALYKEALKETLDITNEDIIQSRIIPVVLTYKGMEIDAIEIGMPGNNRRYLRQISVAEEFVADEPSLNDLLEKLYNERNDLRNQAAEVKGPEGRKIKAKLQQLNIQIQELLVAGELEMMLTDISEFINARMKDLKTLTTKEFNRTVEMLEIYREFPTAFVSRINNMPEGTEEEKRKKQKLREQMSYFNNLVDEANGMFVNEAIDRVQQMYDPTGKRKVYEGGMGVGFWSRLGEGMSKVDEPITQVIFKLLREQQEKKRLKLLSFESEINLAFRDYKKWTKKGFEPLIRTQKSGEKSLVSPYGNKFYSEYERVKQEYIKNKNEGKSVKDQVDWVRQYMIFDEAKWEDKRDREIQAYIEMGVSPDDAITRVTYHGKYNPNEDIAAWFLENNWYIKPKPPEDATMEKYLEDDYKQVLTSSEAKRMLEVLHKYNKMIAEILGPNLYRINSIPNLRASMIEKLASLGAYGSVANFGMTDIIGMLEVVENDSMTGATDKNGKPIQRIPIVGVDPIRETLSTVEKVKIKNDLDNEIRNGTLKIPEGSAEYENELEKRYRAEQIRKGYGKKSLDLVKSLKIMLNNALNYQYINEVEDQIIMARSVLDMSRYKESVTDSRANRLYNKFRGTAAAKQGASVELLKFVDTLVNYHVYGQNVQSKDKTINLMGKQISTNKLIVHANRLLSHQDIALNPLIAAANSINAFINVRVQAKYGKYFSLQSWKEIAERAAGMTDKDLAILWYMEPQGEEAQRNREILSARKGIVRQINERMAYILHRGEIGKAGAKKTKKQLADAGYIKPDTPYFGDDAVANWVMLSMMQTWVLDSDGQIKNPNDPFHDVIDKDAKTLYELFNHEDLIRNFKDGDIPIPGLSLNELARFRQLFIRVAGEIKGSQSSADYSQLDATIAGKVAMQYRKWIPKMIAPRFESFRYDNLAKSYNEGYIKGTVGVLFMGGTQMIVDDSQIEETGIMKFYGNFYVMPVIRRFLNLLGEIMSFGYYKYNIKNEGDIKRMRFLYNKIVAENPEIDTKIFTYEAFMKFKHMQLRAAATELRYLTMATMLFTMIRMMTNWDDEEDNNILTRTLYQIARRTRLELSFWYSPQSVGDIIRSPVPMWKLVNQFGKAWKNFLIEGSELAGISSPNNRDRTPFGYFLLKNTPYINQALKLAGYFPSYKEEKSAIEKIIGENNIVSDFFSREVFIK